MGLILIIATGIFFYIKERTTIIEEIIIPDEIVPLKQFVETCVRDHAQSAIIQLGLRGGYIDIPPEILNDPTKHVSLLPNSTFKVPYWYIDQQDTTPTKIKIGQQISEYVTNNLKTCVNNFQSFQDKFQINDTEPIITTKINKQDIVLYINYQVKVQDQFTTKKFNLPKFKVFIDTKLGKMHDLAKLIMEKENNEAFLEQRALEIIATSGLPYEGMDITCSGMAWSIENDIKPALKNLFRRNLHYLTFQNTKYLEPEYEYYRKLYHINLTRENYRDIKVDTIYDAKFGITRLNVRPNSGDIVKPINPKVPIVGTCFKIFHHRYDIEFPILFKLTDDETGYTFNFATPVIMRDNKADRELNIFVPEQVPLGFTSLDYCLNTLYEFKVYASDKETAESIENTSIEFQCVQFKCDMGVTQKQMYPGTRVEIYGSEPALETKFPYCINGLLIAKKPGYKDATKHVTIAEEMTELSTNIIMTPLKTINLDFNIVTYPQKTKRKLKEGELIIFSMKNLKTLTDETIIYPLQNNITIELGDYEYEISIKLGKDEKLFGGLQLNKWKADYDIIKNAQKLKFSVITKTPVPKTTEEFVKMWDSTILPESSRYIPSIK